MGGEIEYLRRANAVSGWASKHRAELEACVDGASLSAATLVLEIAEDGTVDAARLEGIGTGTATESCLGDVTKRLRFVAAEAGAGVLTLEVPLSGR